MDVLITGGTGTVGTAITDHLADRPEYSITSLDLDPHPDQNVDSIIADARDYDLVRTSLNQRDAVIHLAHCPMEQGEPDDRYIGWPSGHVDNLKLHATVVGEIVDAGLDSLVYASSNHVVGLYEVANAPEIYYGEVDLTVDHTVLPRPDSMYGIEKLYGEGLCRLAAESHGVSCQALRIGAVRDPDHDHPYGDAEVGVEAGLFERGTEEYNDQVARLKCMWQSRRDLAQLVDRCLQSDRDGFEIYYGVSNNDRRWLDIDHTRAVLGYDPKDNGWEWDEPPG